MYILVPILLIAASLAGILFIVWRKIPYLRKLDYDGADQLMSNGFVWNWQESLYDFFPEIINSIKNIKIKEYSDKWLMEVEKIVRRLRVVSLKIDSTSDSLIKKLRQMSRKKPEVVSGKSFKPVIKEVPIAKNEITDLTVGLKIKRDVLILKKEEQALIIEVAKDPKNSEIYDKLGDLYIEMKSLQDAKESFEAAIELNPTSEALKKKLSKVLVSLRFTQKT